VPAPDLGTDLRVVLGPPGMSATDSSTLDIRDDPHPLSARAGGEVTDLATIDGRENLAQALTLRLLTPRGSLADLGHAEYGSRLGELIGRRKTEALRALCRAYVLEAVAQEPRVEDTAVSLEFDIPSEGPSEFRFVLAVQPRTGEDIVTLDLVAAL
jgi:phage baseplate assembly protein W